MARVEFGFGVSDVRGKIGGAVFGGTRAGTIIKKKPVQTHKESGAITVIRNNMSRSNFSWNAISDAQRISWDSFGQLVKTRQNNNQNLFISGRQLYIKYNQYRLLYGLSPVNDPDFSVSSVQPVLWDMELNVGVLTLETSRIMSPANEFIVLSLTPPVRATLNNPGNRFKIAVFATTSIQSFDITSVYEALFGIVPASGQTIFFKVANLSFKSPVGITFVTTKITFP